ncbi:hypothetical protein VN97_g2451 [Penicillium thymicola]|uniref:NADH:flavin oxidoreductase/NADH oxidase N-terminal domain-containing protein n=1 Tax=Penicillium thymicola TaxID=293382 RepID=A0AAI9TP15_PENTH|nr:hypothetical protein VN97_g2451 [Penicillium thymicola]
MIPRHGAREVDPVRLREPSQFHFSKRIAPNRLMKAAMTERMSSWSPVDSENRGIPSLELVNLYKRWGESSVGVILTGNIMVDNTNLEAPGNATIPADAPFSGTRFERFKALATASKAHGSLILGQMSHPGRQVNIKLSPNPVSASDVHLDREIWGMKFGKPHAASLYEIQNIINTFTHSAEFLFKAGFDGIQVHGAHGYLLAQFLSQQTNQRTDIYGGSLRNRARIIIEIAQSIRRKVPVSSGFILAIKLNSVEFQDKGFSPEECRELCQLLEHEAHFDFVELSGGTYEDTAFEHKRASTKNREAFFLEFAEAIVPVLSKTKVYVTGGFLTVAAMETALKTVDGVGLARTLCAEPHLASDIVSGRIRSGAINAGLSQYDYGMTEVVAGVQMRQIGNDRAPIDLTKEDNLKAFETSVAKWERDLEADSEAMTLYGYPDIDGADLPPFNVANARSFPKPMLV